MITLDAELAVMQSFKSQEADWFEEWFGDDYLRIYQHRDESEAERAIELIAARVRGRDVRAVLDLACGAGRHSQALCERWWTVGLDLSAALLRVARRESADPPYVRADMRELPSRLGASISSSTFSPALDTSTMTVSMRAYSHVFEP